MTLEREEKLGVLGWLAIALVLAALGGLFFVGCSDGDETKIISEVVPAVRDRVECCDFNDRDDCTSYPARLLDNHGFVRANRICFGKHDTCLTGCP